MAENQIEINEIQKIGLRAKQLRGLLRLPLTELAKLIHVNRSTLSKLEKGKGFSDTTLSILGTFYGMGILELINYNLPYPGKHEFKAKLLKIYESNKEVHDILSGPMSIDAIIEFLLIDSSFLNEPQEVKSIQDEIKSLTGTKFKSNAISSALIRALKNGLLDRAPLKNGKFIYFNLGVTVAK